MTWGNWGLLREVGQRVVSFAGFCGLGTLVGGLTGEWGQRNLCGEPTCFGHEYWIEGVTERGRATAGGR